MSLEFSPVKDGRAVAEWVKALKGKSGVYVVRERGFLGSVTMVGRAPAYPVAFFGRFQQKV